MPESTIINTFVILVLAVAGFGLMFFLLKKFTGKIKNKNNDINLKVQSKIPLQSKTNLYIVKAGKKSLLIGATDHNISTLADLTDEESKSVKTTFDSKNITEAFGTIPSRSKQSGSMIDKEDPLSFRSFILNSLKKSN